MRLHKYSEFKKLNESIKSPVDISFDIEDQEGDTVGYVNAVVHYNRENFNNWLESERVWEDVITCFNNMSDDQLLPVCILKGMGVDKEGGRNNGYGRTALLDLIRESDKMGCKNIVLIADTEALNDFNLVAWYEKYGFERIFHDVEDFPVMVKTLR